MATYRTRNGRTTATIRKAGYEQQSETFDTETKARRWASSVELTMDRGSAPDAGALRKHTVASLFQRFIDDEECKKRKGFRSESGRLKKLLKKADFVKLTLSADIAQGLRDFMAERLKLVSKASVRREMGLVAGVFKVAIKDWGVPLQTNPVRLITRPAEGRGRKRTWSAADLVAFKEALGPVNETPRLVRDWLWPAVQLAVESAMRLGEICSILKENVHLDQAWLRLGDSKNGDERDVPLSVKAVAILRPLMAASTDPRLFAVNPGSFGVNYREARAAAGLAGLRFHDTRHTATTRLSKIFPNTLELAAVTGHRSLQSLKTYYNPEVSDLAKRLG